MLRILTLAGFLSKLLNLLVTFRIKSNIVGYLYQSNMLHVFEVDSLRAFELPVTYRFVGNMWVTDCHQM